MVSDVCSIYILIPIHNRRQITLNCLQLLDRYNLLQSPYRIVVIDDGSTDGSRAAIEQNYPTVKILEGDGSLWWTGAIRQGMEFAYGEGADYIVWLNDDCAPSQYTIPELIKICQAKDSAIIGCQGYRNSQELAFGGKKQTWKGFRMMWVEPGQIQSCDLLSGNLVCFPKQVIDQIGYPDVYKTPHYGGDSLYLVRARNAGFPLFVDARYPVQDLHLEGSALYPQQWLTAEGEPLRLLKLAWMPQSGLSWQLWWFLNWEAYGVWGIVMFLKKYSLLLIMTALRYLPWQMRQQLQSLFSAFSTSALSSS